MIQEIPYGVYSNNDKNINDNSESKEINEIPLSIEVIAHKAIVIYDATPIIIHNRRSGCQNCFFLLFCCITMTGFLLVVLSFSNQSMYNIVF